MNGFRRRTMRRERIPYEEAEIFTIILKRSSSVRTEEPAWNSPINVGATMS